MPDTVSPAGEWSAGLLKIHYDALFDLLEEHWATVREADDTRYEQRFVAQEKAISAALTAAALAVDKAEENATKLSDKLDTRVDELRDATGLIAGQGAGLKAGWAYLLGFIATVGIIINIILSLNN